MVQISEKEMIFKFYQILLEVVQILVIAMMPLIIILQILKHTYLERSLQNYRNAKFIRLYLIDKLQINDIKYINFIASISNFKIIKPIIKGIKRKVKIKILYY